MLFSVQLCISQWCRMHFDLIRQGNILCSHELNHPSHALALASIVLSLKICRHYFYGEKCRKFRDQKSLKYMVTLNELNLRPRRWIELIKEYDCTIDYNPGKANVVVDALS